jgi:uncharacterized membrane protein
MEAPDINKTFPKFYIPKEIWTIFFLAIALNIARIFIFHSTYFIYILWNIFLAILPFIVSTLLSLRESYGNLSKSVFVLGSLIWLLLLPNAPYIVTDFIHLGRGHGAPILYDTFLLFSSAWLGLLLFMYSLRDIEKIIRAKYGNLIATIKVPSIILLVSIGIYIGRFLRFNSWDVFTDPSFFGNTWQTFTHPIHFSEACIFILPCFFFLYVLYISWKSVNTKK